MIEEDVIYQTLKNKYDSNSLAHFYIFKKNSDNDSDYNIFFKLLSKITGEQNKSHPDFLFLNIEEGEKNYKVDSEEFKILNKFIGYRPNKLKHKFIVISDAELISLVLYNKLLKTFEELDHFQTIILITGPHDQLPETITSRAITLYENSEVAFNRNEEIEDFYTVGLSDFLNIGHKLSTLKLLKTADQFNASSKVKNALLMP